MLVGLLAAFALAAVAGAALSAGGTDLDAKPFLERMIRAMQAYKYLLLLFAAILVVAAGIWLAVRRQWRALVVLVLTALLVAAAVGVYAFRHRFPNQDLFSMTRQRDAAAILLGTDIRLSRFQPESLLVVERENVTRARFPAIDVHFHLASLPESITPERLVQAMDAAGIARVVNLDGTPGRLEYHARKFRARYPDRFILFARPDLSAAFGRTDGVARQVQWLEIAARIGARGVKVTKSFGMWVKDDGGRLVALDDPRLDPIWQKAGELGMPVLIHTADPLAFFMPSGPHNERYEEMLEHPEWVRFDTNAPARVALLAQRDRLVARHPGTNFIGAHMGMSEDDLARVAELLDRYPNYYVDMASVVHALGRQPFTARRFFIRYQDRILFGTDGGFGLESDGPGWTPERYFRGYIEFLETANEYIEYPLWGVNKQGRWRVYGLDLPDDVLEKIYVRNAEKLIPTDAAMATSLAGRFPALESGLSIGATGPNTTQ